MSEIRIDGAIVLTDITYHPFGPVSAWRWGNGTPLTRPHDLDGRVSGFSLGPAGTRQITWDAASRITRLEDPANPATLETFGYDALDRLTHWVAPTTSRSWTYDASGNRLSLQIGSANPAPYAYDPASNRLLAVGSRTFSHNAAGSITSDGRNTYAYDARARLVKTSRLNSAVEYNLDAFGQRVLSLVSSAYTPIQSFSAPARTALGEPDHTTDYVPSGHNAFVYDETARLIGEYDGGSLPLAEHLYLGSLPVATLRGKPGATEVFYVHTDPIGRPAAITDTAGALRWRWDTEPFGSTLPQEDPSGLGALRHNPRFPGQFHDTLSRTNYNYFRDYDPSIGRYIQSDPIGLDGGINTYAYARSNPIARSDPLGLSPTIPFPGLPWNLPWSTPRPFPFDPTIPLLPPGSGGGGDNPFRFCKLLAGINHRAVPGGYSLTCTYECRGGAVMTITLEPWKQPNCPDYWMDMTASLDLCRR